MESAQKDPKIWKGAAPLVAVAYVAKADWAPRAESLTRWLSEHFVVQASQGAAEPAEIVVSMAYSALDDFACSMTKVREPAAAAAAAVVVVVAAVVAAVVVAAAVVAAAAWHVTKQTLAAAHELVVVLPCTLGSRET